MGKGAIKIALKKNKKIMARKLKAAYKTVYGDETVPCSPTVEDETVFTKYWTAVNLLELHNKLKPVCPEHAKWGEERREAFCYCRDERIRRRTENA